MNEECSVVGLNDINSDLIPKESFFKRNKKLVIIFIISIIILIFFIILAIIMVFSKKDSSKKTSENFGDIICIFNVKSEKESTKILGGDFEKKSEFQIIIDETEIKYTKTFQFSRPGKNIVKFTLLSEINMDNMFKNLDNIISVNITNAKILSEEEEEEDEEEDEELYA